MKNSLLEKEITTSHASDSYEEWINSFSGLGGQGFIGKMDVSYEILNLSEIVILEPEYLGV